MKVSSAWGLCGQGWESGGEEGELCSQGSEHLAAVDAPNPLKERFPALGLRAMAFDL